ncbi:MAG: glycerophosphodiester phosphodiesterase [Promethearchaeota archaeon]
MGNSNNLDVGQINKDIFEEILQKKKTIIFAHRGASGYEYENTIPAFRKAIEMGADGIETDAWLLADGNVVLHHDKAVKIPISGSENLEYEQKNISKMTLQEIKEITLPNGAKIPTIEEFFEEFSKAKQKDGNPILFSIDLQDLKVGSKIAEILKEETFNSNLIDRVVLCSESVIKMKKVRKIDSRVKLVASNQETSIKLENFSADSKYMQLKIFAFNIQGESFKQHYKEVLEKKGMKCFIWDLHSRELLEKYIKYKPDAIYSNFPDIAVEVRDKFYNINE